MKQSSRRANIPKDIRKEKYCYGCRMSKLFDDLCEGRVSCRDLKLQLIRLGTSNPGLSETVMHSFGDSVSRPVSFSLCCCRFFSCCLPAVTVLLLYIYSSAFSLACAILLRCNMMATVVATPGIRSMPQRTPVWRVKSRSPLIQMSPCIRQQLFSPWQHKNPFQWAFHMRRGTNLANISVFHGFGAANTGSFQEV